MSAMDIEFDLDKAISDTFFNGIPTGEDMLTRDERADFERKKAVMLENFPWVTEVIEDTTLDVLGDIDNVF